MAAKGMVRSEEGGSRGGEEYGEDYWTQTIKIKASCLQMSKNFH